MRTAAATLATAAPPPAIAPPPTAAAKDPVDDAADHDDLEKAATSQGNPEREDALREHGECIEDHIQFSTGRTLSMSVQHTTNTWPIWFLFKQRIGPELDSWTRLQQDGENHHVSPGQVGRSVQDRHTAREDHGERHQPTPTDHRQGNRSIQLFDPDARRTAGAGLLTLPYCHVLTRSGHMLVYRVPGGAAYDADSTH